MSTTIPDLWSDDIRVDILTPLAILRAQEDLIGQKTQGILEGEVRTTSNDTWMLHQLGLIAPALNHYRVTLLTAKHRQDMVYPVSVTAPCFAPKPRSLLAIGAIRLPGQSPDQRDAATQEEFIELVRQVLHSDDVRASIQSLIALSNDPRSVEQFTTQAQPDTDGTTPSESEEPRPDGT
jgi:hypothetical protein